MTLYRRTWTNTIRHPMQLKNRFFNLIVSFILIGCIFYKGASNNRPDPNVP
jgi:prolipoprotein diacylglyceryltransferase